METLINLDILLCQDLTNSLPHKTSSEQILTFNRRIMLHPAYLRSYTVLPGKLPHEQEIWMHLVSGVKTAQQLIVTDLTDQELLHQPRYDWAASNGRTRISLPPRFSGSNIAPPLARATGEREYDQQLAIQDCKSPLACES